MHLFESINTVNSCPLSPITQLPSYQTWNQPWNKPNWLCWNDIIRMEVEKSDALFLTCTFPNKSFNQHFNSLASIKALFVCLLFKADSFHLISSPRPPLPQCFYVLWVPPPVFWKMRDVFLEMKCRWRRWRWHVKCYTLFKYVQNLDCHALR